MCTAIFCFDLLLCIIIHKKKSINLVSIQFLGYPVTNDVQCAIVISNTFFFLNFRPWFKDGNTKYTVHTKNMQYVICNRDKNIRNIDTWKQ